MGPADLTDTDCRRHESVMKMPDDASVDGVAERVAGPEQLCFVLMPFGRKSDRTGASINFDAVYEQLIAPAVRAARLEPIRANEEINGGAHGAIFESLVLCEYAVADLTFADANVFYKLGVRHAVRPYSTVLLFATGTRLPFEVALDRRISYSLGTYGEPSDIETTRAQLTAQLEAARGTLVDSPVLRLIEGFSQIDRLKTDVFRDQVQYSAAWKKRLAQARALGKEKRLDAVRAVERDLGNLRDVEAGICIDLFLSYRAVEGYEEMVSLVERMPRPLARTTLVREQLGFALNRMQRRGEAERVLLTLIEERGPSSETCGILGRVYKDQWTDAKRSGETVLAERLLDKAVNAYLTGFETDWRDVYPGINAVTLMELQDPPDARLSQLIPVVSYAVERRLASGQADYWDYATRLELAVLARDESTARRALSTALPMVREVWEPTSTANNLTLIREARQRHGDDVPWAERIERELLRKAGTVSS